MPYIPCLDPDRPQTPSELEEIRRELYPDEYSTCPHCGRVLEDPSELRTGLCNSDDCPRHDDPEDDK
jgi:hypothetical protein